MDTLAPWAIILIDIAIAVGMLLVLPLGLRLVAGTEVAVRLWLIGAAPGAVSLFLPRGPLATVLACVYALATVGLAGLAGVRWWRRRSMAPAEIAVLTALVTPVVAGLSLVAERSGYPLMGFDLDILLLTVAHFHYAGFAAALVAGLVCRARPGRAATLAAVSVPVGTVSVAIGHLTGDEVELAGALVLTAGMWLAAWVTWRRIRLGTPDRLARMLFGISALVLSATMLLALDYAVGEVTGLPALSLSWMAATHGLVNAFGFGLCAILAWRRAGNLIVRPGPIS